MQTGRHTSRETRPELGPGEEGQGRQVSGMRGLRRDDRLVSEVTRPETGSPLILDRMDSVVKCLQSRAP